MQTSDLYAGVMLLPWQILEFMAKFLIGIVALLATVATYRLFFHPLAAIPGPKLAAISSIWHAYQAREGRMAALGRTLHQKYGPVVRVGPNEVWFNSKDAFHAIYRNGSGFEKSDFYLATTLSKPRLDWRLEPHFPDSLDLLSERSVKRYRRQRRLVGPVYQTQNLIRHEAAIDAILDRVVARLKGLEGAEVDLHEWMHIISVECLGAAVLSWSPGMLKHGTDWASGIHAYLGWRRKSVVGLFPLAAKLEHVSKSLARAFSVVWGVNFQTPENFRAWFPEVAKKISRRVSAATRPNPPKDTRSDLLADLIQLHMDKPEFTETYLRRMATTNFGAGHETMASTLTSVMAMIGSREGDQARIAKEVIETPSSTAYATASRLPWTQAAIKECKRLYPVISMSLPRKVPPAGLVVDGHFFPPETTVGCNPVALHRNKDVFGPDAEVFNMARWLDTDPAQYRNMEQCSLSWGGGARSCPGRHLAELIVYKVVPALVKEFRIEAVLPEEEGGRSYFLFLMTGVKARFIPRDHEG